MRRHSLFMTTALAVSLLIPIIAPAQTAPAAPELEVVYVLDHNEVVTYDVDPISGIPTQQGTLALFPSFPTIIPSVDDHVLYVTGTDKGVWHLWAYATDATGSPQSPPIQTLTFPKGIWNFTPNPNGRFAYTAQLVRNSQGQDVTGIRYFSIDPATGLLTESPKVLTTYPPSGPCQSGSSGGLGLLGFNPGGDQLNEVWYCSGFRNSTSYYYTRKVDQETGALGPDVPTITTGSVTAGPYSQVSVTPKAIFDYYNLGFSGSTNIVYVYPPSGGTNPLFHRTFAMLAGCSKSTSETVDPSGNYIFFYTSNGTGIARLELAQKQIVDTGHSLPAGSSVTVFSPDERLIYGQSGGNSYPVYVFDFATGAVSRGGTIFVPSSNLSPTFVPALRK